MLSMAKIPNSANKMLAQIYVCLGRQQEAEDAITALLEKEPEYSVAKFRLGAQDKFEDPSDLERAIDALRQAGLPD